MYDIHKAQGRKHQDKGKDNGAKDVRGRGGLKTLYSMLDDIR